MHRPNQDLQNLKFSCLYLFPFSHKVVPQFVPQFGPFLGPIRPYKAVSRYTIPEIFMSLPLSVLSQSGPPKSVGGGGGGGSGVGGVVYHTSTGQYRKTQSVPPPEKTQGWISLSFMCNCFVFGLILYKCISRKTQSVPPARKDTGLSVSFCRATL